MSVTATFDKWFKTLTSKEQEELINHILNVRLSYANEGYNVGPSGAVFDGVNVGPAASANFSQNKQKCPHCGKQI